MTPTDFFDKYCNNGIDYDGSFGFQCVDLYHQYCEDVIGVSAPPVVGAKDIWDNYVKSKFDKIKNIADNFPQKGDIIIWNMGQFGHVAVCVSADVNQFTSFDQNFPTGTRCHYQIHNYDDVLGWLRPKDEIITQPITQYILDNADPNQIKVNLNEYGWIERQALIGKLGDLEIAQKQVKDLETNQSRLAGELMVANIEIDDLEKQIIELSQKPQKPDISATNPKNGIDPTLLNSLKILWEKIKKIFAN